MSGSLGKQSLFRAISKRGYSVQSALKPASSGHESEISTSTKGARLVAFNKDSPLVKISLSFKAGTRYEQSDNYGINHIIRAATVLGTSNFTPFYLHRTLQQYGLNLYCSADREAISYTVETHKEHFERALKYVTEVGAYPSFKPWEVSDNRPRVKDEIALIPVQAKVFDLLHSAAYRTGLGNSLFCDPTRVDKFNNEDCVQFHDEHCTLSRLQVTAYGVDIPYLEKYIAAVDIPDREGPQPESSHFYGKEIRVPNYKEHTAYIAVAGETPGYTKKEFLAYNILKYAYGGTPSVKYGSSKGVLSKAIESTGVLASVTGISAAYTDSGLVGFYLVAEPSEAATALGAVLAAFRKAEISDSDIARAKTQYKVDLLNNSEGNKIVDIVSTQIAADNVILPEQILTAIDSVSSAEIKQAAKKIGSGRLASVFYGDISSAPGLEELK